jgi:hypothetical protein
MAAITAAVGMLLWRRATRKLSIADYIFVLIGASIPVVGVFMLYGWIHLSK